MAKQAETLFKEKVRRDVMTFGDLLWICKTQQLSIRGTPDFLLCLNGYFIALELKASEDSKTSDLQKYNIERINEAGGVGIIVWPGNWQKAFKFLTTISKMNPLRRMLDDFSYL